jgi:hypothetical protein
MLILLPVMQTWEVAGAVAATCGGGKLQDLRRKVCMVGGSGHRASELELKSVWKMDSLDPPWPCQLLPWEQ